MQYRVSSVEVNLSIKVLVADDSDVMRRTVSKYLSTKEGIVVVGEANNFEEAARLVGETKPEVVVIDVRMSRLLDSKTRNIKEICDCRIIAMSISVDDETQGLAETLGADAFIDKMNLYDQLLPKIVELGSIND